MGLSDLARDFEKVSKGVDILSWMAIFCCQGRTICRGLSIPEYSANARPVFACHLTTATLQWSGGLRDRGWAIPSKIWGWDNKALYNVAEHKASPEWYVGHNTTMGRNSRKRWPSRLYLGLRGHQFKKMESLLWWTCDLGSCVALYKTVLVSNSNRIFDIRHFML